MTLEELQTFEQQKLQEDNIRLLSSDTMGFRMLLLTKLIQMDEKIKTVDCVTNKDTVKAHEEEFKKLTQSTTELKASMELLNQAVQLNGEAVLKAISTLESGRKENSDKISDVVKRVETVEKDFGINKAEINTSIKVAALIISAVWAVGIVIVLVAVWMHDRLPHDNPTHDKNEITMIDKITNMYK